MLKHILIGATFINLLAVIWFVVGSTANFKRGVDLESTVIFLFFGFIAIILLCLSLYLLFSKKDQFVGWRVYWSVLLIVAMLTNSIPLFSKVKVSGWLTEKVESDSIQTTSDNKFEYCLELVNMFQKNSSARLYVKNLSTQNELRIPLELPTNKVKAISWSKENHFVFLEPTGNQHIYKLLILKKSPFPEMSFHIYVQEGLARKLD